MPTLTGTLSGADDTLSGELSVYTGSLSKTQFEQIWDKIEDRLNSDLVPEFTVIDDALSFKSTNAVENRVITNALDDLYHVFPTLTVAGTTTTVGDGTKNQIIIYDGANDIPLDNLVIEIPPWKNDDGTFKTLDDTPIIGVTYYDENNNEIGGQSAMFSFSQLSNPNLRAGRIDFKAGILYIYAYYPDYIGENEIVGPWASSLAEYAPGTDPPINSQVIDLGRIEREYELGEDCEGVLRRLGTKSSKCIYSISVLGRTLTLDDKFSITYRADPKYVNPTTEIGLTAAQCQALIDLLNDPYSDTTTEIGLTTAQRQALIALLDD